MGLGCWIERCNPSLLISFKHDDGQRRYIQIDAGKDFKEQVLRWFVPYKIPRLDAVRKGRSPLFWRFMFLHHLRCHANYLNVSQTLCHPLSVYDSLVWLQLILTHEHADAILGLDNVRGVQPFNANNDIPPTPVFVSQHTMDRYKAWDATWFRIVKYQLCGITFNLWFQLLCEVTFSHIMLKRGSFLTNTMKN